MTFNCGDVDLTCAKLAGIGSAVINILAIPSNQPGVLICLQLISPILLFVNRHIIFRRIKIRTDRLLTSRSALFKASKAI